MIDFYYYNPTKIIFGRKSIEKISKEIPKESRVLFVYGKGSIKKNGVYEQVISALGKRNVHEFSGIDANPEYETCLELIEEISRHRIDFLLAVGGGSVIDATKFASLGVHSTQPPWNFMTGASAAPQNALPIGCVQTIPGTGSEMNNAFVISRKDTNEKLTGTSFFTYPRFSALDPETTYSLPEKQTANGIVDMFVHVLEQYITYPTGAILQERQAEALLLSIKQLGEQILKTPEDYNLRANIMWCAVHAANGTLSRGVPTDWATHNIGHVLTALYSMDHARTLAIILGGVWRALIDEKKDKLAQYGRRIWGLKGDTDAVALKSIEKTESFFTLMGLDTRFSDYDLDAQEVSDRVCAVFEKSAMTLGEHKNIDIKKIHEIILSRQ